MPSVTCIGHLKTSKKLIFEAFIEFNSLCGSPTITIFQIKSYFHHEIVFSFSISVCKHALNIIHGKIDKIVDYSLRFSWNDGFFVAVDLHSSTYFKDMNFAVSTKEDDDVCKRGISGNEDLPPI